MENIELGYELRKIRKLKKLTQQEVANLTAVSLKTIQRYEKGQNIPKSFLDTFYNNLNLEPYQGNSINLLYSGIGENRHEEIKYYITEIIKEIGYEFIKIDEHNIITQNPDNIIIKNNITGEYFTGANSPYDFEYSRVVFNFLRTLVEDDLKNATPIPSSEIDFYLSEEYQDFMKWYNAKLSVLKFQNIISPKDLNIFEKKLKKLNTWRDTEIKKIKEKFYKDKKRG